MAIAFELAHPVAAGGAERRLRDERAGHRLGPARPAAGDAAPRQPAAPTAALALADDPQRFLPTVQVGISLVGILAGVFGGARLAGPLGEALALIPGFAPFATEAAFVLVVVLIAYANLILGELVPKQLALRDPERVAVAVSRPMAWLARVTGAGRLGADACPPIWSFGCSARTRRSSSR